jgi:hypothetical protein
MERHRQELLQKSIVESGVHPKRPDETQSVSYSERRDLLSWQGNQGLARRRTSVPSRGASGLVINIARA